VPVYVEEIAGMFVDRVQIEVVAGDGGNGCVSFRREKYVPHGGPDGGDGGHGGSVIMVVEQGVNNLAGFAHKRVWRAASGEHGQGSNCNGRSAADIVLPVPPGTLVIDAVEQFVIKDLTTVGERFVVARGGNGGRGNTRFKTATNRAPRDFTPGEEGQRRQVVLELKVIADVGLVGKPNAGKSTLLSRLSRARPEIADYPFTTKHPNLGRVQLDADRGFILAAIPGLIEGAHDGVGLGHEFLRHIERAGIFVHLLEPMPYDGVDPLDNYRAIRDELVRYNPRMEQRPAIVVGSKAELPGAAGVRDRVEAAIGKSVLLISAVTGQGLNQLTRAIAKELFPAE